MTENIYEKIENGVYQATRIVASLGLVGGVATQIAGLITGNNDLLQIGTYIFLPSAGYHWGTKAGEDQFKRASDLEKKLE
jgi:hypothetical protein